MTVEKHSQHAIESIDRQLTELNEIVYPAQKENDFKSARERLTRWRLIGRLSLSFVVWLRIV